MMMSLKWRREKIIREGRLNQALIALMQAKEAIETDNGPRMMISANRTHELLSNLVIARNMF